MYSSYIYIYIYMHMCMYTCMCMYVYIYIYIWPWIKTLCCHGPSLPPSVTSLGRGLLFQTRCRGFLAAMVKHFTQSSALFSGGCRGGICRRTPLSATHLCREMAAQACYKPNVLDSVPHMYLLGRRRLSGSARGFIFAVGVCRARVGRRRAGPRCASPERVQRHTVFLDHPRYLHLLGCCYQNMDM